MPYLRPKSLLPHAIPSSSWQKFGTDLFTWDNKTYLVTVDFYSRFFEVYELPSTTSTAVTRKLSIYFARYGVFETVVSDNGPQFTAEEFKVFDTALEFEQITSILVEVITNQIHNPMASLRSMSRSSRTSSTRQSAMVVVL